MGTLRKLLRRLFYTTAAVSTLLMLATLILWPVSYFRVPRLIYIANDGAWRNIGCKSGRLNLEQGTWSMQRSPPIEFDFEPEGVDKWSYMTWNDSAFLVPLTHMTDVTSLGVNWSHEDAFTRGESSHLAIPFSYLALIFSILSLLAVRSIRRRRRVARAGLCGKCGYDLRAHGPGDKCPECGTVKKG